MKPAATFRNYDEPARDTVREFYRLNHAHQTLDFVLAEEGASTCASTASG